MSEAPEAVILGQIGPDTHCFMHHMPSLRVGGLLDPQTAGQWTHSSHVEITCFPPISGLTFGIVKNQM